MIRRASNPRCVGSAARSARFAAASGSTVLASLLLVGLVLTGPAQAGNCNIVVVTGEGTIIGDLGNNSSTGPDESSCAFNDTIDEWWAYIPSRTGPATITTCNPGTQFDTTLSVFNGCPDLGGTELACNDDTIGAPPECDLSGLNRKSTINMDVVAGASYLIRVSVFNDSFTGQGGYGTQYEMSIEVRCPFDDDGTECDTDLDGSCTVNNNDLGILLAAYLSTPGDANWNPDADFNNDGVVNNQDLGELLADYLNICTLI